MAVTIVGRSSSHFTRVTRVFAHELGVGYTFQPVFDLLSRDASDYAHNPALKVPILQAEDGAWFGALNICRELSRRAQSKLRIVWPEDLSARVAANAQELVVQGMASEAGLIMGARAGANEADAYRAKSREALTNSLVWLDCHLQQALDALPAPRDLSFLEVSLFCFVTHLAFVNIVDIAAHANLGAFAERFAQRASAQATPYYFDKR